MKIFQKKDNSFWQKALRVEDGQNDRAIVTEQGDEFLSKTTTDYGSIWTASKYPEAVLVTDTKWDSILFHQQPHFFIFSEIVVQIPPSWIQLKGSIVPLKVLCLYQEMISRSICLPPYLTRKR